MDRTQPSISRSVALHYRVLPDGFANDTLILLTDHPIDDDTRLELKRLCDSPVLIRHVDEKAFSERLNVLYGVGASALAISPDTGGTGAEVLEGPVVPFVSHVFDEAVSRDATDIHLEPGPSGFRIRLRIDGMMQSIPVPDGIDAMRSNIAARIKVLAGLDPTPSREPKDGRMKHGGRDLRISILPTLHGESIHLRFLTLPDELPDLSSLGMTNDDRSLLLGAMNRRGGLVMACGPTGSGKSTTLHALLREGVSRHVKVITVEDPVEYELEYATQIEVTPNLPFSNALRSVLRHDPNVILIGEIRDSESAVIALEAALTGHFVLTSLHTDTEIQAINRFKQFGIPLPLVASALHLIVSQRLIRTICGSCNGTGTMDSAHICERCGGSGYHGRTGIFRVLPISDALKSAIQGEQYRDMVRIIHDTAASLEAAGRALIDTGQSTREEMLRVLGSDGGFNE